MKTLRFGASTWLWESPFRTASIALFETIRRLGFDVVEIPVEDPALIDPKVVELSVFKTIPHLLVPVVTDPKKAAGALHWAVSEMTSRYKLFAERGARNINRYNELADGNEDEKLPRIVVVSQNDLGGIREGSYVRVYNGRAWAR